MLLTHKLILLCPTRLAGGRVCHAVFSEILQLHSFGKLLVLNTFYALQYFLGLVNFDLLLSE